MILKLQQYLEQRRAEEEARGRESSEKGRESSEKMILKLKQYLEKRRAVEEARERKLDDDNEEIIEEFINFNIKGKTQSELEEIFSSPESFYHTFAIRIKLGDNKSRKDFIPYFKKLLGKKYNNLEEEDLSTLASCFYTAYHQECLTGLKLLALPILSKIANASQSPATSVEGHSTTPTQQEIVRQAI